MNQPDTRVEFHGQPVSQNTSNHPTAPDVTKFNAPIAPGTHYTYNHHISPVALQDPFQAQNLQKHQWDQEKKFQEFDNVHGTSQPQNLQWNQETWHYHHFLMNYPTFHQLAPDAVRNSFNPDFMNTNNQTMKASNDQPGPSSFQLSPDHYMNYHMLHQPVTKATKKVFMDFNYWLMNQMPPQLALGAHGTPNYNAFPQQNYGFPGLGQNPISFNLLNAATWKFLSTFPNEMMVTNDGRSIFPRFEIGIMNLNPMANYNIGVKLQLVNPQKHTYNVNEKKWREVDRRKFEELPEQETNEVYSEVQTGQDIMANGLKMKLVNIYTIGNEKKKASATSGPMTEERMRLLEHKKKIREQKMIRVFSQQKYVPIFTLYQQMNFGIPQAVATTQFPDTEFITTTSYRNETVRNWKRNNNEFVRGDLRDLNI